MTHYRISATHPNGIIVPHTATSHSQAERLVAGLVDYGYDVTCVPLRHNGKPVEVPKPKPKEPKMKETTGPGPNSTAFDDQASTGVSPLADAVSDCRNLAATREAMKQSVGYYHRCKPSQAADTLVTIGQGDSQTTIDADDVGWIESGLYMFAAVAGGMVGYMICLAIGGGK
jgi:hypothetical protein